MQPSHVFAHFSRSQAFENLSKIETKTPSKSILCWIPSWTPKITIWDVKTSPRWAHKISNFCQKSVKNSSCYGLWSKMPLRSLQEPPESLPRGLPEPSRSNREPPKSRICSKFRSARLVPGRHAARRRIVVDQVHRPILSCCVAHMAVGMFS